MLLAHKSHRDRDVGQKSAEHQVPHRLRDGTDWSSMTCRSMNNNGSTFTVTLTTLADSTTYRYQTDAIAY